MGIWPPLELGVCHWAPVLRHELLIYQSGPWTVGYLEELEGDQGLQERSVFASKALGRKGGQLASSGFGRTAHEAEQGAGRLHRRFGGWSLQGRHLPLLSSRPFSCLLRLVLRRARQLHWPRRHVCDQQHGSRVTPTLV